VIDQFSADKYTTVHWCLWSVNSWKTYFKLYHTEIFSIR